MICELRDNKWLWLTHITDPEDQIIWNEFSVASPNAYVDVMTASWDGIYRKYNRFRKRLARPLLSQLRGVCQKHDLPLEVVDSRGPWQYAVTDPETIGPDFLHGVTLEDYQIRAIQKCCKTECGIIEMPTGAGKTEAICGVCKAIECPTLILADMKVVIDQIKSRLELRDVQSEVGLFYAGKRPNGQTVVVGSVQSLMLPKLGQKPVRSSEEKESVFKGRMTKWERSVQNYKARVRTVKALKPYVDNAQMLIIDECDLAVSDFYKKLLKGKYNGRRRYGFSATPFDDAKPVEKMVLQEHLGSIIVRETRDVVMQQNRIIPCHYKMLAFGLEGHIDNAATYDSAYNDWIIQNSSFHKLVVGLCAKYPQDCTLILVDRTALGERLAEALSMNKVAAQFIHGQTSKKKRAEALKKFESREINVLIGGKIINRGLDLSGGCENLILASSKQVRADLMQKVGRAFRRNKQGFSRVYDFYFRCNRYLYKHSRNRLKTMVAEGFDVKVVFPGGIIDGKELIESKFRISKKLLTRRVDPSQGKLF